MQCEILDPGKGIIESRSHRVEHFGELIQLIAVIGARQLLIEVAVADTPDGLGQRRHRRQRFPHQPPTATNAQEDGRQANPKHDRQNLFHPFAGLYQSFPAFAQFVEAKNPNHEG